MGSNFSETLPVSGQQKYRRRETVIVTDLQDELVLLDPQSVEMFSLNAVGRLIWLALPATPEAAAAQVTTTFAAEPAEALQDVLALLGDLQQSGLVEPSPEDHPDPHGR
jgi:Coenzyme PQQ synthesis protein D (PqqD)